MDAVYDGFISRHVNRKLSEPMARVLARTSLTPNQATWGAFGIAVLSFASFALGYNILAGTLSVSYTRARIAPEYRLIFDRGFLSAGSRDIRLFLIMLGGVSGQVYFCLLAIAILTNVVVFCRLVYSHRYLRPETD